MLDGNMKSKCTQSACLTVHASSVHVNEKIQNTKSFDAHYDITISNG